MRKVCSILFLTVFLAALALPALAAGSRVTLMPSAETVQGGDTFTVDAVLDNSDKINLATVVLDYDKNALELTGGTCHVSGAMVAQVIPDKNAGTFLLSLPKAVTGKIFSFTFQVKNDAAKGIYSITVKASAGSSSGNYIDATGTQITVENGNFQSPDTPSQSIVASTQGVDPDIQQSQSVQPTLGQDVPVATPSATENPPAKKPFPWLLVVLPALGGIAAGVFILRKKKA